MSEITKLDQNLIIKKVDPYLIRNLIASQNKSVFFLVPLQVIEFPLKKMFVDVYLDNSFKF